MNGRNEEPGSHVVIRRRRVWDDRSAGYDYHKISSGRRHRIIQLLGTLAVSAVAIVGGVTLGSIPTPIPHRTVTQRSSGDMQVAWERKQQTQMAHDLWLLDQFAKLQQQRFDNVAMGGPLANSQPAFRIEDMESGQ